MIGRVATYHMQCLSSGCGQRFSLELTPQEFIDHDHSCPACGSPAKRAMFAAGVRNGLIVPGTRAEYPYYSPQLPVKPGQKLGEPNVMSREHERDILAGAYNGDRWEMNQF